MKDFVAIDFETANFEQSSICSMGIVIVKDGELVDNFYSHIPFKDGVLGSSDFAVIDIKKYKQNN